ncbi:MAG: class I SAM-dependent methyltransferase [Nocardioidaceae bacterium]
MTAIETSARAEPGIELDMELLNGFAQQVGGMLGGAATTAMMAVGDALGLYPAMAHAGPVTSAQLAAATDTHERYVREWLAQQVSAGLVTYEADAETYMLPPEHAAVLATDDSPASMVSLSLLVKGLFLGLDGVADAFRSGDGVSWGEQDQSIFDATERFFGVGYRANLVSDWIPAADGVAEKLHQGAAVADIGCGHGSATILLAEAFPLSRFVGYDVHGPSVETARKRAAQAGVSDRVRFEEKSSHGYPQDGYDLVCFFDSLHDLGDPVGAAAHARSALAPGGSLLLVEPMAFDGLAANLANPMAVLYYAASTILCTPNSLSQPVGLGLGTQAGEKRLAEVLGEAGLGEVRRVAENQLNMVLQARVSPNPG